MVALWNIIKNKIATILLGLVVFGIIAWILGPIVNGYYSICRDINERESKMNYNYIYAIPETSLFLQTDFYNDSLYVFVGNDTIIDNCSHFSVRYISDLTLVLMDVVNDSLVYLVDHNNDVDNIYCKNVTIEQIPYGFDNSQFYNKRYTEKSFLYYVPKFSLLTRISIYSGRVIVNDSIVSPMMIKHKNVGRCRSLW